MNIYKPKQSWRRASTITACCGLLLMSGAQIASANPALLQARKLTRGMPAIDNAISFLYRDCTDGIKIRKSKGERSQEMYDFIRSTLASIDTSVEVAERELSSKGISGQALALAARGPVMMQVEAVKEAIEERDFERCEQLIRPFLNGKAGK